MRLPSGSPTRSRTHADDVYAKPGYLVRRAQQIAVALFVEECATFDVTPVQCAACWAPLGAGSEARRA